MRTAFSARTAPVNRVQSHIFRYGQFDWQQIASRKLKLTQFAPLPETRYCRLAAEGNPAPSLTPEGVEPERVDSRNATGEPLN